MKKLGCKTCRYYWERGEFSVCELDIEPIVRCSSFERKIVLDSDMVLLCLTIIVSILVAFLLSELTL